MLCRLAHANSLSGDMTIWVGTGAAINRRGAACLSSPPTHGTSYGFQLTNYLPMLKFHDNFVAGWL